MSLDAEIVSSIKSHMGMNANVMLSQPRACFYLMMETLLLK